MSQLNEDGFNKVKKSVDHSSNDVCTAERAMAVAIDTKVISSCHKYEEVSMQAVKRQRTTVVDEDTFKPPMRATRLTEAA